MPKVVQITLLTLKELDAKVCVTNPFKMPHAIFINSQKAERPKTNVKKLFCCNYATVDLTSVKTMREYATSDMNYTDNFRRSGCKSLCYKHF